MSITSAIVPEDEAKDGCADAAVSLILLPVAMLVDAFAIAAGWSWFIQHKFGLPPLSPSEAAGISLFSVLFRSVHFDRKKGEYAARQIACILVSLEVWGFMWLVAHFLLGVA